MLLISERILRLQLFWHRGCRGRISGYVSRILLLAARRGSRQGSHEKEGINDIMFDKYMHWRGENNYLFFHSFEQSVTHGFHTYQLPTWFGTPIFSRSTST
jgi:hypothetical protein